VTHPGRGPSDGLAGDAPSKPGRMHMTILTAGHGGTTASALQG
jgi:hypothetical protein